MMKAISTTAIAALLLLSACSGSEENETVDTEASPVVSNERAVRVETAAVTTSSFEEVIELTGSVEASDDAILSARSAGTVISLTDLGRRVGSGYIAAQLDAGLAEATLTQAQAQLESAEANFRLAEDVYRRQEPLFADSIISALEFEQVRTQMNQAQAQFNQAKGFLAQAEEQVAYTRVIAPFTGTVEEHFVEIGEQVTPGVPVLRIVNGNKLKISAGVPERYAEDIEVGSHAVISFSAYGIDPIDARVNFVGRAINSSSRTFPIEINVTNADRSLKPEMIATVQLERNTLDDAVVVPQGAIVRDETGVSVFVVDRSGAHPVAEKRAVMTGPSFDGRIVIESGVAVGDELIVAGMNDVSPGDRVELVNAADTIASSSSDPRAS